MGYDALNHKHKTYLTLCLILRARMHNA